jgi:excisionase family DNA binding protein
VTAVESLAAAIEGIIDERIAAAIPPRLEVVQAPPEQELFTIAEAADWLRLGTRQVQRLLASGALPYIRVTPGQRRIRVTALRDYVTSLEQGAVPPRRRRSF